MLSYVVVLGAMSIPTLQCNKLNQVLSTTYIVGTIPFKKKILRTLVWVYM